MKNLINVNMIAISIMALVLGFAAETRAQTIVPGVDLRGAGDNLAGPTDPANTFVKCALTLGGLPVGFQRSVDNGDGTGTHVFQVVGGTLTLKLANTTADITMKNFNSALAAAFPEVANYQHTPGAQIWYSSGNMVKNGPGVLPGGWVGTGTLSNITKLEIRCVYLVVNGKVIKCLGCHYYIS